MNASAKLPMNSATCSDRRVVKTSLNPSESYHCISVSNQTIGLAKKKIRMARPNRPAPIQKRRGGRGMRSSRPSNGPPRSNGSNGRYRRGHLPPNLKPPPNGGGGGGNRLPRRGGVFSKAPPPPGPPCAGAPAPAPRRSL